MNLPPFSKKAGDSLSQSRIVFTHLPMKMEQTECSETLAYKIQMPKNYPEENIQHTEHGESLKLKIVGYIVSLLRTVSCCEPFMINYRFLEVMSELQKYMFVRPLPVRNV